MSSTESKLSDPHYGYDIVVATTQASINATMKAYLAKLQKEVQTQYIVLVKKGRSREYDLISYEELLRRSEGADPFKIPNEATEDKYPEMRKLAMAKFVTGIKLTLGLPNNFDDINQIPDIINLRNSASSVQFRMLCANIHIVEMTYDMEGPLPFFSVKQSDQRNRAWKMVSNVNLVLNRTNLEFAKLPPAMQQQLKQVSGSMFDIQQLLFDLTNAGLSEPPQVELLASGSEAENMLSRFFCGTYFGIMKKEGTPVLNYTVVHREQTSTLKPTDMNFHVSPLVHESSDSLKTLDYLCSTGTSTLPPGVDFTWDWVSAEEAKTVDGVIAINRATFTKFFLKMLMDDAKATAFKPHVRCWLSGFADGDTNYEARAIRTLQDSDFTVTTPAISSDNKLIKISYSQKVDDQAGLNGNRAAVSLSCSYDCEVKAQGSQLIVDSNLTVRLFARYLQNRNEADVVNKSYHDVYDLKVNPSAGDIDFVRNSTPTDRSGTDSVNGFKNFWGDINSVFNTLKGISYTGTQFTGADIQGLDNFIFPGGQTFNFQKVSFSKNQDLLCAIRYAEPVV